MNSAKKILNLVASLAIVGLGSTVVFAQQGESTSKKPMPERSEMQKERMEKYKERVDERCGEDMECREKAKAHREQMQEKRQANLQEMKEKCAGDKACIAEAKKEHSANRKEMKEKIKSQCGDDKDCKRKMLQNLQNESPE